MPRPPNHADRSTSSRRRFLELTALAAGGALLPEFARAEAVRFSRIPYARAERFAAPTLAKASNAFGDGSVGDAPTESDLHLNVWTSGDRGSALRPVWVRIPGGGFHNGIADPAEFEGASQVGDAVIVSVNHRAGLVGYMHLPGAKFAAANHAGNLDIVAALEWVRANIRGFGGDPGNVTIFSGAGGEAKVACLLAMPAARGLFHRALIGSGTTGHRSKPESASRFTAAILRELRIDERNLDALRTLPLATLLAAAESAKTKLPRGIPAEFRPVADGRILTSGLFDSPTGLGDGERHLPLLTKSSSAKIGGVQTLRCTFTWPGVNWSGSSAHGVEVVIHHASARQPRTIAANASLATLAKYPRA